MTHDTHGHGSSSAAAAPGEVRVKSARPKRRARLPSPPPPDAAGPRRALSPLLKPLTLCPRPRAPPPLLHRQPTPFLSDPTHASTTRCKRRWNDLVLLRLDAMSPGTYAGALHAARTPPPPAPLSSLPRARSAFKQARSPYFPYGPAPLSLTPTPLSPSPPTAISRRQAPLCKQPRRAHAGARALLALCAVPGEQARRGAQAPLLVPAARGWRRQALKTPYLVVFPLYRPIASCVPARNCVRIYSFSPQK